MVNKDNNILIFFIKTLYIKNIDINRFFIYK